MELFLKQLFWIWWISIEEETWWANSLAVHGIDKLNAEWVNELVNLNIKFDGDSVADRIYEFY